jgi:hypothetical protein
VKSEIEQIRDMFIADDAASLQNQISDLVFRDCFYRTHNEGLKAEFRTGRYVPSFFLEHFQDDYFLSQAVRLRKILETGTRDKRKKTYSLLTALTAIRKNASKLTLEEYLKLPLYGTEDRTPPQWAVDTTRESRVQTFKLLSGETDPMPSTTINIAYLDKIENGLLLKRQRLYYHLNKYWLHSSDPINRKPTGKEPQILSLNYLQSLLIASVWAVKTLSRYVDVLILSEMPTFTFDPLIGSEIIFSEGSKLRATKFFAKPIRFYTNTFSKYNEINKLYLSTRTFVRVGELRNRATMLLQRSAKSRAR